MYDNLMLSGYQLFPTSPVDSMQFQSNSQQLLCGYRQSSYGKGKHPANPLASASEEEKQSLRTGITHLEDLLQNHSNQSAWYRWKNGQIDQWTKTESPEVEPHQQSQLIIDKGARQHNGTKVARPANAVGTTGNKRIWTQTLQPSQESTENGPQT